MLLAALPLSIIAAPVSAQATVFDPVGDFLASYAFDHDPDLDVTSFSVSFNDATDMFLLGASLAGPVDLSEEGFYVIGVNTGTGTIDPFDDIGQGNVTFNQVIVLQKDGSVNLGTATLVGNVFTISVPLSLLPTTGADPQAYGFNLWPRYGAGLGGNDQISDFAPNNALLTVNGVVPEPATWMTMLLGFGVAGAALRFRRRRHAVAA
jgi:hypothetical protein